MKNDLQISYEFLSEEGKNLSRKQSFTILPLEAEDNDLYDLGVSIGQCLRSEPKSINQNIVYTFVEE